MTPIRPAFDDAALALLLMRHAPLRPLPLTPSIRAWHADDELPLWQAIEEERGERIDAPYFTVCWPGAQALAWAFVTGVVNVSGKRVVDVGAGSGAASVAASLAGALVTAVDVDALACASARLLAREHGVTLDVTTADLLAHPEGVTADVIVAGDLVSRAAHAAPFARAVARWRARGTRVILADSGRPFFDACGFPAVHELVVPMPRIVDGASERVVRIYDSG